MPDAVCCSVKKLRKTCLALDLDRLALRCQLGSFTVNSVTFKKFCCSTVLSASACLEDVLVNDKVHYEAEVKKSQLAHALITTVSPETASPAKCSGCKQGAAPKMNLAGSDAALRVLSAKVCGTCIRKLPTLLTLKRLETTI